MQENPLTNYGEMLKGFREDLCMTQTEVAQALGVTVNAVASWENARRIPNPINRAELKRIYKMPPEADLLSCIRMYSKEELVQIVMNLLEKNSR